MIIKIFTDDKKTIEFLSDNIKYNDVDGIIMDCEFKTKCIIIYDISSIDYNGSDKTITLYYKNIALNLSIDKIKDIFSYN